MLESIRSVQETTSAEMPRSDSAFHEQPSQRVSVTTASDPPELLISGLRLRLIELQRAANAKADAHRDVSRALARETMERYVPLADRIGVQFLRKQLEDASFRILDPLAYEELARKLASTQSEDEMCLAVLQIGVERLLYQNGIKGTVQGRTKGLYSLYRKMRRLNRPLAAIMDRIGLRVIVPSVADCYRVLELLQTHFRPVPGTFDDYIAHPKANGYRSFHACFYPVPSLSYKPVEFQIRTVQMHREAQFGAAAHWRYKIEEETRPDSESRLRWLRGLLGQREPAVERSAFVQQLYRQVFGDRLVMFHSDGQGDRVPVGAIAEEGF
jgi:(p)ppGpp synthase/HD superfamily hydrolase